MGRASGRKSRRQQREDAAFAAHGTPYWAPCIVCQLDAPWPADWAPGGPMRLELQTRICQRCCLADLARVIRECPERFRYLPTIRALRDQPAVVVWGRSGDAEAAAAR